MALPLMHTNYNVNPLPAPNGLGAETRRNLVPNPAMKAATATTQIRTNDCWNPSWELGTNGLGGGNAGWQDSFGSVLASSPGAGSVQGNKALRITPSGSTNDTFVTSAGGTGGARSYPAIANGTAVTIKATITVPKAQTGTLNARARRICVFTKNSSTATVETQSAQAPNAPGTYELTVNATLATGTGVEFYIRLYNGSQTVTDVIYWDAVLVQATSTIASSASNYFDGSLPTEDTLDGRLVRSWDGTAHNSVSREFAYNINGVNATAGAYFRWTNIRTWAGGGCAALGWSATSATMVAGAEELVTLPAATQYTFSAYVYVPTSAPTVKLQVAGPGMTTVASTASSLNNTWQRLTITFTTVTAGTYTLSLRNFAAVTSTSISVNTDAWQVELGASATAYFDGNSTAANLSYQWTGTIANSASTETGLAIPNYVGSNASLSATDIAGYRLAITPNSASVDSKAYIEGGPGGLRTGLTPGKTYYMTARLRIESVLTGTPSATNTRNFTVYSRVGAGTVYEQRTTSSPNALGTYQHSMVFTVPPNATEAYVSLNNGFPTGGGAVYWDQIMITEGEYSGIEGYLGSLYDPAALTLNQVTLSNAVVTNVNWHALTPSSTNVSYAEWHGGDSGQPIHMGIQRGRSYTITGQVRLTAALTTTLNANSRRIVVVMEAPSGNTTVLSNQATNSAATTTLTVNFTTPDDMTAIHIQLWNGAASGGGVVNYTNVTLKDNTLPVFTAYFDGETGPAYDNRVSRWFGAANSSRSQYVFRGLWVEGDASVSPPRVTFVVSGLGLGKVSRATIYRRAGNDTFSVPGWLDRNVNDLSSGIDWLVPLNVPVEYQLWVDGSQIDTESIQFNSPAGWVSDPLVPGDAMPVYTMPTGDALQLTKAAMETKEYAGDYETTTVIGSRYPVARANTRKMLQGLNLSMNAPANSTSDQFAEMIQEAPILVFRTHPSWGNVPPLIYLACDVTERPVNRQTGGQFTVWEVTGDAVAALTRAPLVSTATYAQVKASVPARTYQSIKDVASSRRYVDIIADPLSLGG